MDTHSSRSFMWYFQNQWKALKHWPSGVHSSLAFTAQKVNWLTFFFFTRISRVTYFQYEVFPFREVVAIRVGYQREGSTCLPVDITYLQNDGRNSLSFPSTSEFPSPPFTQGTFLIYTLRKGGWGVERGFAKIQSYGKYSGWVQIPNKAMACPPNCIHFPYQHMIPMPNAKPVRIGYTTLVFIYLFTIGSWRQRHRWFQGRKHRNWVGYHWCRLQRAYVLNGNVLLKFIFQIPFSWTTHRISVVKRYSWLSV